MGSEYLLLICKYFLHYNLQNQLPKANTKFIIKHCMKGFIIYM